MNEILNKWKIKEGFDDWALAHSAVLRNLCKWIEKFYTIEPKRVKCEDGCKTHSLISSPLHPTCYLNVLNNYCPVCGTKIEVKE
jgi:hypothetical protein